MNNEYIQHFQRKRNRRFRCDLSRNPLTAYFHSMNRKESSLELLYGIWGRRAATPPAMIKTLLANVAINEQFLELLCHRRFILQRSSGSMPSRSRLRCTPAGGPREGSA